MTWVFALVAVAVMVGVALVAAGHGTPLADDHGDRPDAGLPAEGPVDAAALRRVRFPVVVRGYRMAEVDALLERLAAEREELDRYRPPAPAPAPAPAPDGERPHGEAH